MRWDDDDWVGEPPEGRHTRDRAKPEFWNRQRIQLTVTYAVIGVLLLMALLILLL
jgi:hypothetical protein